MIEVGESTGALTEMLNSLADFYDPPPVMETVIQAVSAAFGGVFGYQMQEESLDLATYA